MNKNNVIIIGGGVAGLSAALHCAEKGLETILIEAGSYPAHKVCGEFFSPESIPLLTKWGLEVPVLITSATIISGNNRFTLDLPKPAGSMSRFYFDNFLAHKAQEMGAQVLTNTSVTAIRQDLPGQYNLELSSGQTLTTSRLVLGTGRVTQLLDSNRKQTNTPYAFWGFKAHFSGLEASQEVMFHTFPGAYLGISSIENNKTNVACLAQASLVNNFPSPQEFIQNLISKNNGLKELKQGTQLFDWLTVKAPAFGIKKNPDLKNIYFIGDAAGTIPPAAGDGLALGLLSGKLVAEYIVKNDYLGFKKAWLKNCAPAIKNGLMLHIIMINPWLAKTAIITCNLFPSLARQIFKKTRINL